MGKRRVKAFLLARAEARGGGGDGGADGGGDGGEGATYDGDGADEEPYSPEFHDVDRIIAR
eukprot:2383589-Prymnesium_polylepis.1